jgi:hypothetical protein
MTAFWDVVPCSLMEGDQCFRGVYCLPSSGQSSWRQFAPLKHQTTSMRLHSATFKKAVIFILATIRTGSLPKKILYLRYKKHSGLNPRLCGIQQHLVKCPLGGRSWLWQMGYPGLACRRTFYIRDPNLFHLATLNCR